MFQLQLCEQLGKTLVELRTTCTDAELKLWYAYYRIKNSEDAKGERTAEAKGLLEKMRGSKRGF